MQHRTLTYRSVVMYAAWTQVSRRAVQHFVSFNDVIGITSLFPTTYHNDKQTFQ